MLTTIHSDSPSTVLKSYKNRCFQTRHCFRDNRADSFHDTWSNCPDLNENVYKIKNLYTNKRYFPLKQQPWGQMKQNSDMRCGFSKSNF